MIIMRYFLFFYCLWYAVFLLFLSCVLIYVVSVVSIIAMLYRQAAGCERLMTVWISGWLVDEISYVF